MKHNETTTRRTLLGSIVTGAIGAVSGCLGSPDGEDIFADVFVDGTELVVDLEKPAVDQVDLLTPSGQRFADQSLSGDTDQVTIEIGTEYEPGEHEVVAIEDGDELGRKPVTIEPDVRITELRLGRNHPDEMFDGASDREIRTEVILEVRNKGTGPEKALRLEFDGDIPRRTPSKDEFPESGIYDVDSDIGGHAEFVKLPADESVTLYSQRRPFSSHSERVSCEPETQQGQLEVSVDTAVQDGAVSELYNISYTGEDLIQCDIEVD